MMKNCYTRRTFLASGVKAGMACCMLATAHRLYAMKPDKDIPDPRKLCYCGYKCPENCKFLQASLKDVPALKKEAFELWTIEERYGIKFDPETAICYGCKVHDRPQGIVVSNCTVRDCAMEKELDCCIECDELTECDKTLWKRYPGFHKIVIEMQEKYLAAKRQTGR